MSATLLVLAAGLGSRYSGGIKQMDPVGTHGEYVLDYSIFDAVRGGFDKVVLVVRKDIEDALREHFRPLEGKVDVQYAVQSLDDLPAPFQCPAGRAKPRGTGHAVWAARHLVKTPFAAINADDFYGARTFQVLGDFLNSPACDDRTWALVAFQLANTLSEHGTVNRGVCNVAAGALKGVEEHTGISPAPEGARYTDTSGQVRTLTGQAPVSLNFWGFTPAIFPRIEALFSDFLAKRLEDPKAELHLPVVVDTLIREGIVTTRVLHTPERWIGMTYQEDRPLVIERIRELTRQGLYPENLWNA